MINYKNLFLLSFLLPVGYSNAIQQELYELSLDEYCEPFLEIMPKEECIWKYETNALEKGIDPIAEEQSFEKAKIMAFEDGTFTLTPGAKEYRFIEKIVSPTSNNTYSENRHHVFYLNPEMKQIEHLMMTYRHGLYGNNKQSDNEFVHISRNVSDLNIINKQVYWAPSYPTYTYIPVDMKGFTLYEYNLGLSGDYATPNYSANVNDKGTEGQWLEGTGHKKTSENNSRMSISESFSPEATIQFGYNVFLMIKDNGGGAIEMAMPTEDQDNLLVIEDITTLLLTDNKQENINDMDVSTKETPQSKQIGGWFFSDSHFRPENASDNDWRKNLAMTSLDGYPRYICRFQNNSDGKIQTLYGLVTGKGKNDLVCSGGNDILLRSKNGMTKPFESQKNKFEWLSLSKPSEKGKEVKDSKGRLLCHLNSNQFYGVGYVNKNGQCTQDQNIYWSNGNPWLFSKGWSVYRYE